MYTKRSKEMYEQYLEVWRVSPKQLEGENRGEAMNRILASCQFPGRDLDLSGLNLSSIPDLRFTSIDSLDISKNQISDISNLGSLTHLRILNISHNKIDSIAGLKGMNALENLNISYNVIPCVKDLSNLNKLRSLKCSNNMISSIDDLRQLDSLRILYCANNQMEGELDGFSNLWMLNNGPKTPRKPIVSTCRENSKGDDAWAIQPFIADVSVKPSIPRCSIM